tara:strand:- start:281 stop:3166 length:2886 start_codon:yes stop_codon:yes gene_type:complete
VLLAMASQLGIVNRIFVKRTRRGQVKTHVRQHYLRDDLPTGSPHLDSPALDPKLDGEQYLVLDTNIVLHQIDLLEKPVLCNVIILQTVLEEVQHNKISVYKRLRTLIDDATRKFHVFNNEFHREVYTQRMPGESPNDRNDRAIRDAASWYQRQLDGLASVLLITNDAENLQKASAAGLKANTIEQYVATLPQAEELQDVLARSAEAELAAMGGGKDGAAAATNRPRPGGLKYEPHLPLSELTRGVQAGELHQGKLRVSRYNPSKGAVAVHSLKGHTEVLVRGRQAMNRSIEGDIVVVRLLPKDQWSSSEGKLGTGRGGGGGDGEEDEMGSSDRAASSRVVAAELGENDFPEERIDPPALGGKAGAKPCAVVVGIIKRNWKPVVCVLDPETALGSQYLVEPLDARIPKINISTRQAEQLTNKLLLVALDFWEPQHRFPTGHYVRTLGDVGDTAVESEAILLEHEVKTEPFSQQVQACLPVKGWQISEEEIAKRLDLRGGPALVCSVDPPGCVDIDDALHARDIGDGLFEVGVHIADVGHFIKAGTPIDVEAALRGTTVYLVNRRIDMVPKRLGEDLCSLHGKVDRLAFSCIWTMDADANIKDSRFVKTVICSEAALSYEEAQIRMDDERICDPLTLSLRTLNSLAKKLKARRHAAGALTLGSPEVKFVLDSESSDPTDVGMYTHREANSMVEEFMLLANISVAKEITRAFPQCAMLRRHPQPLPGSFDSLKRSLKQHGFELDVSTSLALGHSLDKCVKKDDAYFNQLARILATRSMQQARYFSSGSVSPEEYAHYGLAAPIYTHFTSPIRRYADQMVHRLLASIIGWEAVTAQTLDANLMGEITDNINHRHTMAQYAGRASVGLHTLVFFRGRTVEEDAYIIKVRDNGVVVLVPRYGIEGIVFVADKAGGGAFTFDEKQDALISPSCTLKVFDKVRVNIKVDSSKPHRPKLALAIVKPVLPS